MSGIRALRRIQSSIIESPRGTVTAATVRLFGNITMKHNQKYYRPADMETGTFDDFLQSDVIATQMGATWDGPAYYEQLGYLLGMSIKGAVSPTGGGSYPSVYTYAMQPTATQIIDTRTLEYGDNNAVFRSPFCFFTDIEFSGKLEDIVKVKGTLVGQYAVISSFASVNLPTQPSPIKVGTGKVYFDTSWANLGLTQLSGALIDFSYKLVADKGTAQTPIKYMDGNLYYTDIAEQKRHIELDLTLAFNSDVSGLFADYTASPQTTKFWNLEFTGPAITGGYDGLELGGGFIIDDYSELKERDGQDIVSLKLRSIREAVTGNNYQVILSNAVVSYA